MNSAAVQNTFFIKTQALRLGFDHCGIAQAVKLDDDARRLEQWLHNNRNGSMKYMENYFDLRTNPTLLVPGAKSVITLLKNYYNPAQQAPCSPRISMYAWGQDYHITIKKQLQDLLHTIKQQVGDITGRGFVDSAPVLERSWALRSGLGWIGKNGNLITKHGGSYFFIATLITDLNLVPDMAFNADYCGTCTACLDACPTQAILPGKVIEGSKCISYATIELKDDSIPQSFSGKLNNWIFGCDICQQVCPWNRFSKPHSESDFTPYPEILNLSISEWENITQEQFKKIFKHSPLARSKWKGLMRNIRAIKLLDKSNL